ncbi:MAG TPA: AHH domain-containing protein, partial [Polyangium sp.]|nr:AHH domain-containing protein [Polyangium sp.]
IIGQVQGTLNAIDAYEQGGIVDAINTANPLMGVVNLGFAIQEGDWYTVGVESVGVAVTVVAVVVAKKLGPKAGPRTSRGPPKGGAPHEHHVMTNKNYVSTAQGGPWSPLFEKMAAKAGMSLTDAANKVRIPGHSGPHPEAYHREVHRRLTNVTKGLSGDAYTRAFRGELDTIRTETAAPGSALNQLITRH